MGVLEDDVIVTVNPEQRVRWIVTYREYQKAYTWAFIFFGVIQCSTELLLVQYRVGPRPEQGMDSR